MKSVVTTQVRLFWTILIVGLAGVAGLALLKGGEDGTAGQSIEYEQVAYAAERTAEFPGSRATLTGTGSIPGAGMEMTMTGEGVYNGETNRSEMTMTATIPGVPQGPFNPMEVRAIADGDSIYMTSPAFGAALPGGKSWMLTRLPEGATGEGDMDPREQLEYLQAVSDDIQSVGTESVNGVGTTHYRGTIDDEKYVDMLREQGYDELADQAEEINSLQSGSQVVDVWIDDRDLVRRMSMEIPFDLLGGDGATLAMTMEFSDFGIKPRITPPPASDVFDATALGEQYLDELTGS